VSEPKDYTKTRGLRNKEDVESYRVGSIFKACLNCRSTDVRRSYNPAWSGWTHYCFTCSAKDNQCWKPKKVRIVQTKEEKEKAQQDLFAIIEAL
jgi:hypothetical protein